MRFPPLLLLLAAFAPVSHAEEKLYDTLVAEPVPPTVIPMGRTEKDLTPAMREVISGLEVSKRINHLQARLDPGKYPANPIEKEKTLHDFWIKERTLSPDEAEFAYACLGIVAEDQVLTRERIAKRGERTDTDMRFQRGSCGLGYMLTLACDPLKVRYSREKKAQVEEVKRVTSAALNAAGRRHRAILAAREPDYDKNYEQKDNSEADAVRAKLTPRANYGLTGVNYPPEAVRAYIRIRATKTALFERARQLESLYEEECQTLARVFLQWIPGDKNRVRQCLIDAGYATPEARIQFWKIASTKPQQYFNEEHLSVLYDPKTP